MTEPLTPKQIAHNSDLLNQASANGDVDAVKRLIPISNPTANNCQPLLTAVSLGHVEIVQLLLPVSERKAILNLTVGLAIQHNQIAVLGVLLPHIQPEYLEVNLRFAVIERNIEAIKTLVPYTSKKDNTEGLRAAVSSIQQEIPKDIVGILLPISNYENVFVNAYDLSPHRMKQGCCRPRGREQSGRVKCFHNTYLGCLVS